MLGRIITISTFVALVALWVVLMKTAPASAGPMGILTVFVLMYIAALGMSTFLLYGASIALTRIAKMATGKSQPDAFTLRKAYYRASVVALGPVMIVGMQSVNEVGIYQFLLIVFFVIIAWLYVTKRTT